MSNKVKECQCCGQGFDEDNNPVGAAVPSTHCPNAIHEGPIIRIPPQVSQVPQANLTPISTDHIFVLGDDSSGNSIPHSTAIAIGKRTVLTCAHSLVLTADPSKRSTRKLSYFCYVEEYWIQSSVSIDSHGNVNHDGRIPLKLYKFNVDNDWALLERADGQEFTSFISIDTSPSGISLNTIPNVRRPFVLLHCPVSLLSNFTEQVGAYSVHCNFKEGFRIQGGSSHHIYYEGSNLVRGSSGGAIQWTDTNELFAMHFEVINEAEFDVDEVEKNIAVTAKQVTSEDDPYQKVANPPKKQKSCDSETLRSISGGNQGQGSAIIISRFKRLMHHYNELESKQYP